MNRPAPGTSKPMSTAVPVAESVGVVGIWWRTADPIDRGGRDLVGHVQENFTTRVVVKFPVLQQIPNVDPGDIETACQRAADRL